MVLSRGKRITFIVSKHYCACFVCSSSSSGEATIQIATVAEAGDEGIRVKKNLRVPAEFSKNSTGATKGLRGEERR
eukprot:COSAG02_NODE_63144_length_264_cov_0.612121_1_plen_75_part_10